MEDRLVSLTYDVDDVAGCSRPTSWCAIAHFLPNYVAWLK